MRRFFILSTFLIGTCFIEALAATDAPLCPAAARGHTMKESTWHAHGIVGLALKDVHDIKRQVNELKGQEFDETVHWCKSPSKLNPKGHTVQQSAWAAHNLAAILKGHLEEIRADLNDIRARQQ